MLKIDNQIKNMKNSSLLLFLVAALLIPTRVIFANATLQLHLLYNMEQDSLTFDKSFSPSVFLNKKIDTNIFDFTETYKDVSGSYELFFLDSTGLVSEDTIIDQIQFTPTIGSFTLNVPDYNITRTLVIRKKGSSVNVLKYDVSQYISCNLNKICEFEKGETTLGCMFDCSNSNVKYSAATQKLLNQNDGKISDPDTGETLLKYRPPVEKQPDITSEPEQTYTPTGYVPNQPEDTNTYTPGDNFNLSDQTPDNTSYTPKDTSLPMETSTGMGMVGKAGIFFGVLLLLVMPPVLYFRFKKKPTGY
jgi:hypothetical protein